MKYNAIKELDARIEREVKRTVENYYTDWKNYDRPKYMKFKGSNDREDKQLILIARACGTYLIRTADIYRNDWATTLFEYYQTQERASYFLIDLSRLSFQKIDAAAYGKELKRAA